MTRPPVRMCARCERTTDQSVLVHEVHAATGPGFNVYACRDRAGHYPPQADPLELLEPVGSGSRMRLRVYRTDAEGAVTEDRCTVEILADGRSAPVPRTTAYPPCGCVRCGAAR